MFYSFYVFKVVLTYENITPNLLSEVLFLVFLYSLYSLFIPLYLVIGLCCNICNLHHQVEDICSW